MFHVVFDHLIVSTEIKSDFFYKKLRFLSFCSTNNLDPSELKVNVISIFVVADRLWLVYLKYHII